MTQAYVGVHLRIRPDLIAQVDQFSDGNRTRWIIDAITEKLAREEQLAAEKAEERAHAWYEQVMAALAAQAADEERNRDR